MENKDKSKKYHEWIKGGFGTMGMLTVMNTVYVVYALVKKDLTLWLEFSVTEFMLKNTSFFKGYTGSVPLWAALVVVLIWSLALLLLSLKSIKKPMMLIPCTVLYLFDTALLAYIMVTDHFNDFNEASWINAVVHAIMLLLLASGIFAAIKKNKLETIETEEEEKQ